MKAHENYIKSYETIGNAAQFIERYWGHKLKKYDEIKKDPDNMTTAFGFVFDIVTENVPRLLDFSTKDELIRFYKDQVKKTYLQAKLDLDKMKIEHKELLEKYKDIEIVDIAYWRKHPDLNEYLTNLAKARKVISSDQYFNGQYLLLTKEDLKNYITL